MRSAGGEPGAEPVLGDVRDAGGDRVTRIASRAASARRPARCPPTAARMPEIVSASSRWPLPATPAIADDLAGAHAQRDVAQRIAAAIAVRADGPRRRARPLAAWLRALLPRAASTSRPTISAASDRGVASATSTVATVSPAAKHRHAVGDRHHLVELVRDEDHGLARRPPSTRSVSNSSSASCGVSTAVGSSMIRIRASR